MKYKTVLIGTAVTGFTLPLLCFAFSRFMVAAELDPFSTTWLLWSKITFWLAPTYYPVASLLWYRELSVWEIVSTCMIGMAANAVIHVIVGSLIWWSLTKPSRYIALAIPVALVVGYGSVLYR